MNAVPARHADLACVCAAVRRNVLSGTDTALADTAMTAERTRRRRVNQHPVRPLARIRVAPAANVPVGGHGHARELQREVVDRGKAVVRIKARRVEAAGAAEAAQLRQGEAQRAGGPLRLAKADGAGGGDDVRACAQRHRR